MQYVDLYTWLRGDILVKADRMSMAHSLELRVPFLDKEVFDVAAGLPVELKLPAKSVEDQIRAAASPGGCGAAGHREPARSSASRPPPGSGSRATCTNGRATS